MYPLDDTIAAIASPPGGAARGIVRISGPEALDCLTRFFIISPLPLGEGQGVRATASCDLTEMQTPCVVAGMLRLPDLHSPIPCDAYVWPDERSYTGQSVVEIHTVGSPPLLEMVLHQICATGARLAGPGEFTLRAFLAGRIDLTQAEAVLGVIDAGDADELQTALGQLAGGLARPLHRLRDVLLELLAHLEAGFDFADEDIALITREELGRRLAEVENDVAKIHRQMDSRTTSSHHIRVVLIGRPNTGKSSLFNALAGDRAALVSEHPGTTRDYLTAELELDGVKCQLIDTAGTGEVKSQESRVESGKTIEDATASATADQRRGAHLELLCIDSTRPLDTWERDQLALSAESRRLVVLTKCDATRQTDCTHTAVETSSVTNLGIYELREELRRQTLTAAQHGGEVVAGTAVRCADSLRLAGQNLRRARQVAAAGQDELAAAEIRMALVELGKVVGEIYTDDVLDRIFSRFCVGK